MEAKKQEERNDELEVNRQQEDAACAWMEDEFRESKEQQ